MSIKWNKNLWNNIRTEVKREVIFQTEKVFEEIVSLTNDTKSGRIYIKHDAGADTGGRRHQASAPGEPWANDTGNALENTYKRFEGGRLSINSGSYSQSDFIGYVGINTKYALGLELGTEKIEPRPTAIPALENRRNDIFKGIRTAVRHAVIKSGGPWGY